MFYNLLCSIQLYFEGLRGISAAPEDGFFKYKLDKNAPFFGLNIFILFVSVNKNVPVWPKKYCCDESL